ncbi:MAG: PmoA family protein [Candidatus Hydrogenedentes bacterium]|nr:PmoA family protein [Candidatus Hydrogenedentota bacterium]
MPTAAFFVMLLGVWPEMEAAAELHHSPVFDYEVLHADLGKGAVWYEYGKVPYKPYVEKLLTPSGVNILRDSPSDHKHHHGLMFAVKVNDINFWEEQTTPGRQVHVRFDAPDAVEPKAKLPTTIVELLDWTGPTENLLLHERRTVDLHSTTATKATLITWRSEFTVSESKPNTVISGAHYHGLGMRFLESMDKAGHFFNADGKSDVAGTNDIQSNWCAYAAEADNLPVTVAMFNDPANPRSPARWFTMDQPFAYLSATLNLHREPLTLSAEVPLRLRYGVALWDGRIAAEEIERLYQEWLAMIGGNQPTAKK